MIRLVLALRPAGARPDPSRMLAALLLLAATGCVRAPLEPPEPPAPPPDYRNGWFHFADGASPVSRIASLYDREPELVADLNFMNPQDRPPAGLALYVPPTNDRTLLRETLERVNADPRIVPRVPPRPESLRAPSADVDPATGLPRLRPPGDAGIEALASARPSGPESDFSSVAPAVGRLRAYDVALADPDHPLAWPVRGSVVQTFDAGADAFLPGILIEAPEGSPVFAAADGVVVFAGDFEGYGRMVILDHENGRLTVYGHNRELVVRIRQRVRAGDRIAESGTPSVGSPGRAFFQVREGGRPVDPLPLLPRR